MEYRHHGGAAVRALPCEIEAVVEQDLGPVRVSTKVQLVAPGLVKPGRSQAAVAATVRGPVCSDELRKAESEADQSCAVSPGENGPTHPSPIVG